MNTHTQSPLDTPSSPLIVRLPNWVGDVIMALPALEGLAKAGFQLHLFGKPWIQDLLQTTPYTLHALPKRLLAIRRTLTACPAKHALLLTNSFSSALHCKLSQKEAIGYRTDGRHLLLKESISKAPDSHEVELFYQVAAAAAKRWGQHPWPNTQPPPTALPLPEHRWPELCDRHTQLIERPYWVLCPFAVGRTKSSAPKIWPH